MCETSGEEKWSLLSDISAVQFFVPGVPMSSLVKFARLEKCSEFFLWPNDMLPTTSPPPPSTMLMVVAAGGRAYPTSPNVYLYGLSRWYAHTILMPCFLLFFCVSWTPINDAIVGKLGEVTQWEKQGLNLKFHFQKWSIRIVFTKNLFYIHFLSCKKNLFSAQVYVERGLTSWINMMSAEITSF